MDAVPVVLIVMASVAAVVSSVASAAAHRRTERSTCRRPCEGGLNHPQIARARQVEDDRWEGMLRDGTPFCFRYISENVATLSLVRTDEARDAAFAALLGDKPPRGGSQRWRARR